MSVKLGIMRLGESAVAVLCGLMAAATASGSDWTWHSSMAPHFEIQHEMAFMPGGFSMGLEKIHGRLRLDLAGFSPWMAKERLKLFLYKNRESYAGGEFKPPPWSNGISMYEKRTVAVYDQADRKKLMEVIAHETTHLLFESYWGEVGRQPPSWINEGLAMVEEGDPDHPERSDWFRAMVYLPQKGYLHVSDLVQLSPTLDLGDNKSRVETFYTESYSLVYFLLRKHSKLQFKNLCAKLREGEPLEQALWLTYRYKGTAQLEKAWVEWVRDPRIRGKAEAQAVGGATAAAAEAEPEDRAGAKRLPRFGSIDGFKPLNQ